MLHNNETMESEDQYLERKLDTATQELKTFFRAYYDRKISIETTINSIAADHLEWTTNTNKRTEAILKEQYDSIGDITQEINRISFEMKRDQERLASLKSEEQTDLEENESLSDLVNYIRDLKTELDACKIKIAKEEKEELAIKNSSSFVNKVRWAYRQVKNHTISVADLTGSVGFITNIILNATKTFESISLGAKMFFGAVSTPLALSAMGASTLLDTYDLARDEKVKQRKTRYGTNLLTIGLIALALVIAVGVLAAPAFSIPLIFVGITSLGFYKNSYVLKQTLHEIDQEKTFIDNKRSELQAAIENVKTISATAELHANPKIQRLASQIRDHVNHREILKKTAEHLEDGKRINKMFYVSLAFLLGGIAAAAFPPVAAVFAIIGAISIGCAIVQGYRTRYRHQQEMKDLTDIISQQNHKQLESEEIIKARSSTFMKTKNSQTRVFTDLAHQQGQSAVLFTGKQLADMKRADKPANDQPKPSVAAAPINPNRSTQLDSKPVLRRSTKGL